ncbi:MAG: RNA polymerase sigma factor, partial [Muribaculaceae bacterium]|nr:RNA polymerase sigma factor [Muribaculaceae bacterium]
EAGRTPTVPLDTQPEPLAPEAEDFEQEFRRINRLLTEIPDEQAEVIRLRYYGDKSFQEIADILGIPLTTAKSRFTYGLEKIKRGMRAPHSV